jgi:hypothetical protein
MERSGEHVSAEPNSRNNRRDVFSVPSLPKGYKKDKENRLSQLSFKMPACQDMTFGAEALLPGEWLESLEMAVGCLRRENKKGIRLWKEDFMCAAVTLRLL